MNILQINASARSEGAQSTRLANSISDRLRAQNPVAQFVLRDLARAPMPVLDEAALGALFTPADQRTAEQAARVAIDDAAIAEIQAADVVVLGVPMYNFQVSVQFKAWIDAISRARVTFQYTDKGPEGLLKNKQVYVALARGGMYRDTPADHIVPYLKTILGFLGMTDVRFVFAEGLGMGEAAVAKAFEAATQEIEVVVDTAVEAVA